MKQKPVYLMILLLFLIATAIILLQRNKYTNNPPPVDNVIPGKTNAQQFLSNKQPYLATNKGESTDYYIGNPTNRDNATYTERNGVISHYLEREQKKFLHRDLQGYRNEFGEADLTRYNNWYTYGKFTVFVFLQPGIAVTAHPESGVIMEEWHIIKELSKPQFDEYYNTVFQTQPPTPKNQL